MDPKRIALVNQPFSPARPPTGCDSIAIWNYQIGARLAEQCHVNIFGRSYGGSKYPGKNEVAPRDRTLYVGVDDKLDYWLRSFRILDRWRLVPKDRPFFCSRIYGSGFARKLTQELGNADVVHIHNYSQFAPIIKEHNATAKIVLHMHCEWLTQLNDKIVKKRLDQTDRVIGCSDYITNLIKNKFPEYASRCETVCNGVDETLFQPPASGVGDDHCNTVLFVGRISPEKGLHVLLEAFRLVLRKRPDAVLKIIGPKAVTPKELLVRLSHDPRVSELEATYPWYREGIERMIPADIRSQIIFVGNKNPVALPAEYQRAAVLVNPSLSEAFGMSIVEAMACAVPVVATAVGGMRNVVADGETGYLVEPGDSAGLAEKIDLLLGDRRLAAQLGANGRDRVQGAYTWDHVMNKTSLVYRSL